MFVTDLNCLASSVTKWCKVLLWFVDVHWVFFYLELDSASFQLVAYLGFRFNCYDDEVTFGTPWRWAKTGELLFKC